MNERAALTKAPQKKTRESISTKSKENVSQSMDSPVEQILHLQRTIGNQAVQRLVKSRTLQAKLTIGKPDDKYEQEADRVADQVMRMPEPGGIQRKSTCPECEEKEEVQTKPLSAQITTLVQRQVGPEEEEVIQSKGAVPQSQIASPAVESNIQSLKGGGQPLPESTRSYFEPRFGADFSQVRVHNDSQAAGTARAINAKAFTTGKDVVFGAGQYSPGTSSGKQLLAHELTHVVQQSSPVRMVQSSSEFPIQRNGKNPTNIQKLDEMLSRIDVPEEEVIVLLGKLKSHEKKTVLSGRYKKKIAAALDKEEMIRAVKNLNPKLSIKLEWIEEAALMVSFIDYSDIQSMITSKKTTQNERNDLKTLPWRDFFVDVCTNVTMVKAVNDLKFDLETKLDWMRAEMLWVRAELAYSDIKKMITSAPQPERNKLKTDAWRDFFVEVCTDVTMAEAVNDLKFDKITKLEWMLEEGTRPDLIEPIIKTIPSSNFNKFFKEMDKRGRLAALLGVWPKFETIRLYNFYYNLKDAALKKNIAKYYTFLDPSRLPSADIEAFNEYKKYMAPGSVWQKKEKVTKEEARLACQLIIRHISEGNVFNWKTKAKKFMTQARRQLGVLKEVKKLGGDLSGTDSVKWEPQEVKLKRTEFGKWLLSGGPAPNPKSGTMNCWEVILYGAYQIGYVTKSWLKTFYTSFTATLQATAAAGGDVLTDVSIENKLKSGKEYTFTTKSDSPAPLPGDLVIFKAAVRHTAISLGTKTSGKHDVYSLWNKPGGHKYLQKTTIEALLSAGAEKPVKFWSPKWK